MIGDQRIRRRGGKHGGTAPIGDRIIELVKNQNVVDPDTCAVVYRNSNREDLAECGQEVPSPPNRNVVLSSWRDGVVSRPVKVQ